MGQSDNKKNNIILITTDQQRFDTIAALGNRTVFTPHLDWLAEEGTVFERFYADCPVCMPSRGTIMTGLQGYKSGCVGNFPDRLPMKSHDTLPGILTRNGYQTRGVGKMHFEPARANYGFEHIDLALNYYREMREHPERGIPKDHGTGENEMEPALSSVHESCSMTHWVTKKSIDFLETRDPTRPFFLWTSFTKPHPPFDPCLNYWNLYEDGQMEAPVYGNWSDSLEDMDESWLYDTYMLNHAYRMTPQQMQKVKRAYYALITQVDYSLGLLFARVRELGLLDSTWIIFTSDHGEMLGDHHMGAKFVFLEGSAHVPLLIRPPYAPFSHHSLEGKRSKRLAEMADLFPTILSMAGIDVPQQAEGVNLLAAADEERRTPFYGNVENRLFTVMEGYEKYLWTAYGGAELFFDLKKDLMEREDLSKNPKYADRLEYFRGLLTAHMLENGAACCVKDGLPAPVKARQTRGEICRWPGFHSAKERPEVDGLH